MKSWGMENEFKQNESCALIHDLNSRSMIQFSREMVQGHLAPTTESNDTLMEDEN